MLSSQEVVINYIQLVHRFTRGSRGFKKTRDRHMPHGQKHFPMTQAKTNSYMKQVLFDEEIPQNNNYPVKAQLRDSDGEGKYHIALQTSTSHPLHSKNKPE